MEHTATDPNSGTLPDKPAQRRPFFMSTGELTPEGQKTLLTMSEALAASFRRIARITRRASSRLSLLEGLLVEAQRGPTIGRKRRARRTRGRARRDAKARAVLCDPALGTPWPHSD